MHTQACTPPAVYACTEHSYPKAKEGLQTGRTESGAGSGRTAERRSHADCLCPALCKVPGPAAVPWACPPALGTSNGDFYGAQGSCILTPSGVTQQKRSFPRGSAEFGSRRGKGPLDRSQRRGALTTARGPAKWSFRGRQGRAWDSLRPSRASPGKFRRPVHTEVWKQECVAGAQAAQQRKPL